MRKRFVQLVEFVTYGAGILFLMFVLLIGVVRIQEWIFRHRPEPLLQRNLINARHTTWLEWRSVFERWHGSVSYGMPYAKENCDCDISMGIPIVWRNNSPIFLALLSSYCLVLVLPA